MKETRIQTCTVLVTADLCAIHGREAALGQEQHAQGSDHRQVSGLTLAKKLKPTSFPHAKTTFSQ